MYDATFGQSTLASVYAIHELKQKLSVDYRVHAMRPLELRLPCANHIMISSQSGNYVACRPSIVNGVWPEVFGWRFGSD
jgi:hypothetical protein